VILCLGISEQKCTNICLLTSPRLHMFSCLYVTIPAHLCIFHEIQYSEVVLKCVVTLMFLLQSEKNNGNVTRSPTRVNAFICMLTLQIFTGAQTASYKHFRGKEARIVRTAQFFRRCYISRYRRQKRAKVPQQLPYFLTCFAFQTITAHINTSNPIYSPFTQISNELGIKELIN
jgi:hypothetical protein